MDHYAELLDRFIDLAKVTASLPPAQLEENQRKWVGHCRSIGQPFVASTPHPNPFFCRLCGAESPEAALYFEDPGQNRVPDVPEPWGPACGKSILTWTSVLHAFRAHGEPLPPELRAFLSATEG